MVKAVKKDKPTLTADLANVIIEPVVTEKAPVRERPPQPEKPEPPAREHRPSLPGSLPGPGLAATLGCPEIRDFPESSQAQTKALATQ